jgi:uracil-DNA glycosylase
MNVNIEQSWKALLADQFESEYFANLVAFVKDAYAKGVVYPPGKFIFEAFNRTSVDQVKVVLLGQDPYHNPDQAHGLAFSVQHGVALPPSLRNIYKELEAEYGKSFKDRDGDLSHWADQGVLLLNATLTVSGGANMAGTHQGKGWETFTDAVIRALASRRTHLVYLLWGAYAQRKAAFVDPNENLVLKSAHPSPLSAHHGFFGNGHFKACNDYLVTHGKSPIEW